MPFQLAEKLPDGRVPDAGGLITAARHDPAPVRRPGGGVYRIGMFAEFEEFAPGG
jgi:hypothetical protein